MIFDKLFNKYKLAKKKVIKNYNFKNLELLYTSTEEVFENISNNIKYIQKNLESLKRDYTVDNSEEVAYQAYLLQTEINEYWLPGAYKFYKKISWKYRIHCIILKKYIVNPSTKYVYDFSLQNLHNCLDNYKTDFDYFKNNGIYLGRYEKLHKINLKKQNIEQDFSN